MCKRGSHVEDKLFGPVEFTRRDLAALDIMRGRDNGLPDYNTVRRHLGLPPITNWTQINEKLARTNSEASRRFCWGTDQSL
ncbi:hypothetical protein HPB49_026557 [Dermacentor silvarum]|nr:hypothetical protein HPB49_026557 [Dermacentor silvarum]